MSILQSVRSFNDNEIFTDESLTEVNSSLNKEKLKLEFFIINSSGGSFYSVQAKLYEAQLVDFKTELKQSNSEQILNFDKFMLCNFFFGKNQNLSISIIKDNQKIKFNISLGYIVGSRNNSCIFKYNEIESLMIKCEKLAKTEDILNIKFLIRQEPFIPNYFEKNKYIFSISNKRELYSSSYIKMSGAFKSVRIPINLLQPSYTVDFYNSNYQLIASINKKLEDLKKEDKLQLKIPLQNNIFLYLYDNSIITQNFSFLDYIRAGVKTTLSIAIDFTRANGNPFEYGSLHSLSGNKPNDYYRAIETCGNIFGTYDLYKNFLVYGFGAKINSSSNQKPSMCFNLNFLDNPGIQFIEKVLEKYKECIGQNKITFSGPALFTPLINQVVSRIDKRNLFEYHILTILTSGSIGDLQQTIDALVEASSLPLSVIIIGIGNNDFSKMEILDGDDIPLISTTGKIRMRDLVQFVPFSKYQNDEKKLKMEFLAEIPRQIVEYYQYKKYNPNELTELSNKNYSVKDSLELYKEKYKLGIKNKDICSYSFQEIDNEIENISQIDKSNNNNNQNNVGNNNNIREIPYTGTEAAKINNPFNQNNNNEIPYTGTEAAKINNPFYQKSTKNPNQLFTGKEASKNQKSLNQNNKDLTTLYEQLKKKNNFHLDNMPTYETEFINKQKK